MGIDLQRIIVMCGIFKQTVERIEHLVGEKKEKLPNGRLEKKSLNRWSSGSYLERPP